jgi:uncharacterized protein (DUF362 family)
MYQLTRREMLRQLGIGAIGLPVLLNMSPVRAQSYPRGVIARNGDPETLTFQAIAALGGMERFVKKGQTVLIKPNIGWDRRPEQGANTHPEVVAAIVKLAINAGAKKVLVGDNTCNDPRRCYKRSGIATAAENAGAKMIHLREGRGTEKDIGGKILQKWPVFREILEADVLINAPVAKHHSASRATLGMKNWYGAIDGMRNQLHQNIPQTCVDLAAYFKPHLTVLDGTRVLTTNGPQGGNLDDVIHPQAVMASTDPVAVDAFGGSLLSLTPEDLPHLALAAAHGLGDMNWQADDIRTIDTAEQH